MSLDTQMRNEWAEMDEERIRELEAELAKARAALKQIAEMDCGIAHMTEDGPASCDQKCFRHIASEALKP